MTAVYATATVATGAMSLEIVQYEPVSKIGGASTFTRTPQRFPSIAMLFIPFSLPVVIWLLTKQ